ncbi:hypothetical protein EsH8_VI_000762 [Colletotrichum jinshuiense]
MSSVTESRTTSLAKLNRVFWDANADTFFEQDWLKAYVEQLTRFLRIQAPNLGLRPRDSSDPVRLLDYACAYGGASWALAPFVDEILGIDVAPAIVARFNDCATRLGYDSSQAHAIAGDLYTDASLASPGTFDVVIISMALHHLDDPPAMLNLLAQRLKPGGVLIAVEGIDHNEPSAKEVKAVGESQPEDAEVFEHEVLKTTNRHVVFSEDVFKRWFEDSGCDGEKYVYIINDEVCHIPENIAGRPGGLNKKLVIAASVKES